MNLNHQDEILVLAFVRGEMEEGERLKFESRMRGDENLKEAVEYFRLGLEIGIQRRKSEGRTFLKGLVSEELAEGDEKDSIEITEPRAHSSWFRRYAAAAALLVLGSLALTFYLNRQQPTWNERVAERFEPYLSIIHKAGPANSYEPEFKEAMLAYSKQNYREALQYLDATTTTDQDATLKFFYRGNASLAIAPSRTLLAIESFEVVLLDTTTPRIYREYSEWNIAIAFAMQGNESQARQRLERMVDKPDFNAQLKNAARELLQ